MGPAALDTAIVSGSQDDDLSSQVKNELASLNDQDEESTQPTGVDITESKPVVEKPDQLQGDESPTETVIPVAQPQVSTEPESESVTETETETETETSQSLTDAKKQGLVITINADSWTDIRDASGNKLVYDLLRSGETVEVDGKAPFRAFFGNGYGVSMQYRGEDVDLSSMIKPDNTAKLNIGR